MRHLPLFALILTAAAFSGCERKPAPPPPKEDAISIQAPGVDIQIDRDKDAARKTDVDVEAPGVDVKVD